MDEMTFPDFRGRIVALELSDDDEAPFTVLENSRFEVQAGRVFLAGRVPYGANEDDWCAGVDCAVAWDRVIAYYLFDSVDEYLHQIGELE